MKATAVNSILFPPICQHSRAKTKTPRRKNRACTSFLQPIEGEDLPCILRAGLLGLPVGPVHEIVHIPGKPGDRLALGIPKAGDLFSPLPREGDGPLRKAPRIP